jgi:hypothetical protein
MPTFGLPSAPDAPVLNTARPEAELFERYAYDNANLGHAMIRDGNGARSFDTLLRYRGGTLAELWRALRTLKALQAERHAQELREAARTQRPDDPERRGNPDDSGRPGSQVDRRQPRPRLAAALAVPNARRTGARRTGIMRATVRTRNARKTACAAIPAGRDRTEKPKRFAAGRDDARAARPAQRGLAHGVSPAGAGRSGSAPSSARSRPRPRRSPRPPARTRAGRRDRAAAPR